LQYLTIGYIEQRLRSAGYTVDGVQELLPKFNNKLFLAYILHICSGKTSVPLDEYP